MHSPPPPRPPKRPYVHLCADALFVCAGTLFPVCAPMCGHPGAYVHVCAVHGFHDFSSRPHGSYVQRRRGMCMRWGPLCAASCSEFGQGMCMYVRPAFCMCRLCLCVPTVGWKYHTTIHGRTRTYPCTYPSANNRTYPQEADLHIPPGVARKQWYRNECLVTHIGRVQDNCAQSLLRLSHFCIHA